MRRRNSRLIRNVPRKRQFEPRSGKHLAMLPRRSAESIPHFDVTCHPFSNWHFAFTFNCSMSSCTIRFRSLAKLPFLRSNQSLSQRKRADVQLREVQLREEPQREQFERACKFARPNPRSGEMERGEEVVVGDLKRW